MKTKKVDRKGFEPDGELIGNSNTGVLHEPGCRAIEMMNHDHEVPTNGAHFRPCGWCKAGSGINKTYQTRLNNKRNIEGLETCNDPKIIKIFDQCLSCGSPDGIVKMYPHEDGVRILGKQGKWWVYFECFDCGYETALWKAMNKSMPNKEAIECSH
jgi:hypothetical protein